MQELGFLATNQYGRICFHLGNLCLPFHHSPLPYMSSGKNTPDGGKGGKMRNNLDLSTLKLVKILKNTAV